MQISIKGFITNKETEFYSDCADRYAVNPKLHRFAISDGVSISFFPKYWSEILVNKYTQKEDLSHENGLGDIVEECQIEWMAKVKEQLEKPDVKWYTKSSFNRKSPALATFAGLRFIKEEGSWKWEAMAIGDSFIFFLSEKSEPPITISSKSVDTPFDNFPDYLTSIGEKHKGVWEKNKGDLRNGCFYLMTDALAEWFLKNNEIAGKKIELLNSQEDFTQLIEKERASGSLSNDDSALLIIMVDNHEDDIISYGSHTVSDIQELINVQERNQFNSNLSIEENNILLLSEPDNLTKEECESAEAMIIGKENKPIENNELIASNEEDGINNDSTELLQETGIENENIPYLVDSTQLTSPKKLPEIEYDLNDSSSPRKKSIIDKF